MRGRPGLLAGAALALLAALPAQAQLHEWKMRLSGHGAAAVPPPVNTDPVGVVLNGLSEVYHLKATNGPRIATTNTSVYAFPTGAAYNASTLNTNITGSVPISGLDNAGKGGLYLTGSGSSTLTDVALTTNSGVTKSGVLLDIGRTEGGAITGNPTVDIEHCTIDESGGQPGNDTPAPPSSIFRTSGIDHLTVGFCNITGAPRDPFTNSSLGGTITFNRTYWGPYAQSITPLDHNEFNHGFAGVWDIGWSYYNMRDGTKLNVTDSGAFQIQTGQGFDPSIYTGGATTWNIHHSIIDYGSVVNQVSFSVKAVFADATVNVGPNDVISPAATAAFGSCVQQADLKVTTVVGTFTTSETITATGGKSAPLLGALTGGNNLHLSGWGSGAQISVGQTVTGATSGATAVVTSAGYWKCAINDMGGNRDFAGNPISVP